MPDLFVANVEALARTSIGGSSFLSAAANMLAMFQALKDSQQ
jgi:hypothetical protein